MAKKKIEVEMYSYGEYTAWDRDSKALPKLLDITNTIKADIGTEFGYVLIIKKAKGKRLSFRIEHPPFKGDNGKVAPPFTGEYFIRTNNYQFFLGDSIWEPLYDKLGSWKLYTYIDGELIASKDLKLIAKHI
ncbi:DUF3859 domain-containing protein [Halosquirtibacter xylanolyticus]|uniref:DUF3859 domain-containing protein n=1 Tax=Halosquirtibacter xylanolyticus TaxID=3374599 RepID=UPI00374A4183|nr:DUF3859 domain-containing protein [Prolixibacteraceae bacterium]